MQFYLSNKSKLSLWDRILSQGIDWSTDFIVLIGDTNFELRGEVRQPVSQRFWNLYIYDWSRDNSNLNLVAIWCSW